MASDRRGDVPSVLSVVPVDGKGRINLRKEVTSHLGAARGYCLEVGGEVRLRQPGKGERAETKGRRLDLSGDAAARLGVSESDLVALVERREAVAVKKLTVEERPGVKARALDIETPTEVVRVAETNPMPDELLPQLAARSRKAKLNHSVRSFIAGRETLHAWLTRREVDAPEKGDDQLGKDLASERQAAQLDNGSWDGDTMLTARNLWELSLLGLNRRSACIRKGAEWLLARDESEANPGMFFLSDRLVARQAEILAKRQAVREGKAKGTLGALRFAGRTPSEARKVLAADDMIEKSCGTRIMWPNALALRPLLRLGYEDHPRVQRALESLLRGYVYWCECNYQMGAGTHSRRPIPGDRDLKAREAECIAQYRFGGVHTLEQRVEMPRTARATGRGGDAYLLRMRAHIQPCEVVTTRSLCEAKSSRVRRAAAAHLWRFASVQHTDDGSFADEDYMPSQEMMLEVFGSYDHPASRVAFMRSVPWIVANQNADGSWGGEGKEDANTLAVVQALLRVRDLLPEGMIP